MLIGPPRDLRDRALFRRISLVAVLAWVGLGADGLSSSAYGPEEAFHTLGEHRYLALALAGLMASTVLVIASAYRRIIERFPHGGGGYVVATRLLGKHAGVVSGSALLVDYVLTITISIAASGNAIFSMLPAPWHAWKLPAEILLVSFLTILNLRGVRESVLTLAPIFLVFLATHVVLIGGGILARAAELPETLSAAGRGFEDGLSAIGLGGMLLLLVRAYSLGGGTYTGIEAVSNGLPIMREPHVETGKRTMLYMGVSLAFTATGLLLCYLLWDVRPVEGKTLNAALVERFVEQVPLGGAFVILTMASEGALLVVAAQAGFVDGPRVLANMAIDSWMPRRFAALSDRLTTQNGIVLMGAAALGALLYTRGDVRRIVVMYAINVFLTFSLSMLGMLLYGRRPRSAPSHLVGRRPLFAVGLGFCVTILGMTVFEKFAEGGWVTLLATGCVVSLCLLVRGHYRAVARRLTRQYASLEATSPSAHPTDREPDPESPMAAVLVTSYGGLGLHTFLAAVRSFPDYFRGVVFLSVGEVDANEFKGEGSIEELEGHVREELGKYVAFARAQGLPAVSSMALGTDVVDEAVKLCLEVARRFPRIAFFSGRVLFGRERWYHRLLHNETAFAIQKRLQWSGRTVIVVPARLE